MCSFFSLFSSPLPLAETAGSGYHARARPPGNAARGPVTRKKIVSCVFFDVKKRRLLSPQSGGAEVGGGASRKRRDAWGTATKKAKEESLLESSPRLSPPSLFSLSSLPHLLRSRVALALQHDFVAGLESWGNGEFESSEKRV